MMFTSYQAQCMTQALHFLALAKRGDLLLIGYLFVLYITSMLTGFISALGYVGIFVLCI